MYALRPGLILALVLGWIAPALGADKRPMVGKLLTDSAGIMMREKANTPWRPVLKDEDIPADELLVALPGARLESKNKAVQLYMMSDVDNLSPLPVIESAVILHEAKDYDLDFTIDRGRVDVVNAKEKGEAKVKIRFQKKTWELTLNEPGTRIAFEIYGRWLPGSKFTTEPGPKDAPLVHLIMLVIKGKVDRKDELGQHAMSAPPGAALFEWDSVHGMDKKVQNLDKLPAWATLDPATTERGKASKALLDKFRDEVRETSVTSGLKKFLHSDKPEERKLGVYACAALDELPLLGETLTEGKHADTWDHAVIALRHWLGRAPGQEQIFYLGLVKGRGLTEVQAEGVVQLLFGFNEEEEGRPELYQLLIDNLKNEAMAVRGLVYWHLKRLAPAVKVDYSPTGSKDSWDKAIKEYRDKIPKGKLPPKVKLEDKK